MIFCMMKAFISGVGQETMHMFIGQFFKENSNFDILEVLELISRTQVDLVNNILMDYDRELFVLKHYM